MIRIKFSPFLKDIGVTTLTSVATIVSLIFVTRFLAKGLGPDEFGAYALARRIVAFIVPFSTLTMGVSLARYTALSGDWKQRQILLSVALSIVIIMAVILSAPWFLWGKYLTELLFHHNKYANLFYSSLFMIAGYGIYAVLYAFYRGTGNMNKANLLQFCVMSFIPLLISSIFANKGNAALMIVLMGVSFYLSIPPLWCNLKGIELAGIENIKKATKDLLIYGLPRAPGSLAFAGLLAMGPFFAPYFGSIDEAGYFVVGQSVFRIMESSVVAFGLVALPKVALLFEEGKEGFLAERIRDIIDLIIHLGLFIAIQTFIWSKFLVMVWLGPDYLESVTIMRILIISLAPYLAYVLLRSVIDAVEIKAVNALNLFIALGVGILLALIMAFSGMGVTGLAIGTMTGFFVLGILTVFYLQRRFGFIVEGPITRRVVLINGIIFILSWAINKWWFEGEWGFMFLGKLILLETMLSTGYIAILWRWKVGWLREINLRLTFRNNKGSSA